MLLRKITLDALASGKSQVVYRRWEKARVQKGSTFRTRAGSGVISVEKIERVALGAISERAARAAGYVSKAALAKELARFGKGPIHRITLRRVGEDPRIALRAKSELTRDEIIELETKLARFGASTADGPWADTILRLIEARPAVRAPELALSLGMPTSLFKPRVRQLKELGLTESLAVGYRLSPRGRALLTARAGAEVR